LLAEQLGQPVFQIGDLRSEPAVLFVQVGVSASTDRWLIAVDAGGGAVVVPGVAWSTAACRSACRWMNERCTCALLVTEEMVISDPSAYISASAWWTRCRRRSTSRRRARASGLSPVVMGRSSGAGGQADAGHGEVDELAGHGPRRGSGPGRAR
jgi:hypothetical protein